MSTNSGHTVTTSVARGLTAMWFAVGFFAVADAIAKWQGEEGFSAAQIVFFRYVFGIVPAAVAVWLAGLSSLRTQRPAAHVLRAGLMASALALFFHGLQLVPLADAIAAAFTAPLFITALSVPVLGERVGGARWMAVLVGFVGMLVMVRPGGDTFRPELLVIVASALVFAFGITYTRRLTRTEATATMFAWTTVVAALLFAPLAAAGWLTPQAPHLAGFAVLGLMGGAAHILVIVAYRNADAAIVAPLEYLALVWGALIGWAIWREVPAVETWVGAAIVALAGGFIAWRETRAAAATRHEAAE